MISGNHCGVWNVFFMMMLPMYLPSVGSLLPPMFLQPVRCRTLYPLPLGTMAVFFGLVTDIISPERHMVIDIMYRLLYILKYLQ
jgi:hypothetical protein